jgi:hypothetical protein
VVTIICANQRQMPRRDPLRPFMEVIAEEAERESPVKPSQVCAREGCVVGRWRLGPVGLGWVVGAAAAAEDAARVAPVEPSHVCATVVVMVCGVLGGVLGGVLCGLLLTLGRE